jgi:hypothetical protein
MHFPLRLTVAGRIEPRAALEAEYDSAPIAVEWGVLRALTNFATALFYSRGIRWADGIE